MIFSEPEKNCQPSHHYIMVPNVSRVKKVQVGKDQEKTQSENDSHSKNRGGKKPN